MGRKGKRRQAGGTQEAAKNQPEKEGQKDGTDTGIVTLLLSYFKGAVGSVKVEEYQQKTSKLFISGLPSDATDDEVSCFTDSTDVATARRGV
jgi:hypothetical protein